MKDERNKETLEVQNDHERQDKLEVFTLKSPEKLDKKTKDSYDEKYEKMR